MHTIYCPPIDIIYDFVINPYPYSKKAAELGNTGEFQIG